MRGAEIGKDSRGLVGLPRLVHWGQLQFQTNALRFHVVSSHREETVCCEERTLTKLAQTEV